MARGGMMIATALLALAPPFAAHASTSNETRVLHRIQSKAGNDLRPLYEVLCPEHVLPPPETDITDRASWYAAPGQALDDLFYLGQKGVSAWALKTDEGLVIIDALFDYSVKPEIVQGLESLGLDPSTIRYVIITHGHSDHYGGARYLQDTFGARVIASRKDWDLIESTTGKPDPKPRRDIAVDGSMQLRLGRSDMELIETPGHTPGTLSLLFPVHDRGKKHVAALWGGTAFNSRTREQYAGMGKSARLFAKKARKAKADVWLSNHPVFDGTFAKLAARQEGRPSPFVTGAAPIRRAMSVAARCSAVALARDYP